MKVRALRGVCIGVDRHLKPADIADIDPATVQFLVSICAVEKVTDLPTGPAADEPEITTSAPAKAAGKKEK